MQQRLYEPSSCPSSMIYIFAERATCDTVKCTEGQTCLVEANTKKPRCVSCSVRPKWCRVSKGDPSAKGPICSTNGRTYRNWCEMTSDACDTGIALDTKHFGKCKDSGFHNGTNISRVPVVGSEFSNV
jgi:hypothetical protein